MRASLKARKTHTMSYLEDLFSLKGKNAVVTGAASGLGQQCAQVLARAGANVAILDVNEIGLHETSRMIEKMGTKVFVALVDVSQLTQVETGLRQVIAAFGQIDIVVNCAGIVLIKPALDNTEQDWDRVFGVNIKGTWLMCQTAAKHMIDKGIKGSIINISSADSHRTQKEMTAYCSTKASVNHLTRSRSYELAPHGIRLMPLLPVAC
jgi:NAD(P)-dependent dehydrogenase (short-subunit alcohol dehydrogenase family)